MLMQFGKLSEDDLLDKPGIYTFYYSPKIGDYDLQDRDGVSGDDALANIIQKKCLDKFNEPGLKTTVRLPYEKKLEGILSESSKKIRDKSFYNRIYDESVQINSILKEVGVRRAFKRVINDVQPLFSTPIYIGVSHDIQDRLMVHKDKYFKALDLRNKGAEVGDKDFGSRAANFCKSEELFLSVKYIDAKDLGISKRDSYELAMVIEWVLQQQVAPILGEL